MVRVRLHGDRIVGQHPPHVVLADDCGQPLCGCGSDPPSTGEHLVVRLRTRTGFDDNDNPRFSWATLLEGQGVLTQKRTEFDAEAGQTLVKAMVEMASGQVDRVPETAVLVDSAGWVWRITACDVSGGVARMQINRIDQT